MKQYSYLLNLVLLGFCLACAQPREQESTVALDPVEDAVLEVAPEAQEKEEEPATPINSVATEVSDSDADSQQAGPIVYVTTDGDKYHTADCRYSKDASPVKLQRAKSDGKTACGICKPSSTTGEKQRRCTGTTAESKRCQRMTTDASGKCFQHKS